MNATQHRSLASIASDIRKNWVKVSPYAKPYLEAMESLDQITGRYYEDTAESVVLYFLCNAHSWKGETAKAIKKELNDICKLTHL
jgi:hypothetical protein